jgi:hypothetical protein
MAIVRMNAITKGISGSIGNIVFRQYYGNTVIAGKSQIRKKQSEQQRENRNRFKAATYWAKAQMLDPEKKAYYWRKAKKLKLPNAYTAAISDYMRKGEIKEIDARQYKGKAGDVIRLKISKKDFAIHKVDVSLWSADGTLIETAIAVKKDQHLFHYKVKEAFDQGHVTIRVVLADHTWNSVKREIVVDRLKNIF